MKTESKQSIWVAGLALFSMFFGAGNIVFPIMVGQFAGGNWSYAAMGFILAGVMLPCFGLITMLLYNCNTRAFFARLGQKPGFIFYSLLVFLLGPLGSTPRLITVSYATLEPYLFHMGLPIFSAFACLVIACFVLRKGQILKLLGYVLTPILLACLTLIISLGLSHPTQSLVVSNPASLSFTEGLNAGYALLDVIASLLYAGLVLVYLKKEGETSNSKPVIRRTLKASMIAIVLLSVTYVGLILVGAFNANLFGADLPTEQLLRVVSIHLLGPAGGIIACLTVALACLTTAISQVVVCTSFLNDYFFKGRGGSLLPLSLTLVATFAISLLGFGGIGAYLNPIMTAIHPPLLLFCIVAIVLQSRTKTPRPRQTPFAKVELQKD